MPFICIGMNIALQEEKIAFQDRIDDIETNYKVIMDLFIAAA